MVCKLNATIVHRACFVGRFADLALPNPVCKPRSPVVWTLPQPDYAHSGGDRTVGDDDALASAANELRYLGGETRKLFCVERVGARPSENAGAELEENAPGFSGHAELLSKSENESAQKQYPRQKYRENQAAYGDFLGIQWDGLIFVLIVLSRPVVSGIV